MTDSGALESPQAIRTVATVTADQRMVLNMRRTVARRVAGDHRFHRSFCGEAPAALGKGSLFFKPRPVRATANCQNQKTRRDTSDSKPPMRKLIAVTVSALVLWTCGPKPSKGTPPEHYCPGAAGCEKGNDGNFTVGIAAKTITPLGWEQPRADFLADKGDTCSCPATAR